MSEPDPARKLHLAASLLAERRAYVRLESDLTAACRRPAGRSLEPGWTAKVRDLSPGGIGLLLRHRFRPGTVLTLDLRDGTGRLLRTVSARVVHVTPLLVEGIPTWLLGCAFDQPLSDEAFRALL
jgi:hypothetical protein